MNLLRCGIVGCGVISHTHIKALESIDRAELVAICDHKQERLDSVLKENPELKSFLEVGEMLKESQLDVVIICTDHASHSDVAIQCFEAGCHVICEKPLTAHREDLDLLIGSRRKVPQQKAGGIFQNRFRPTFHVLKRLVEKGKIGKVLTLGLQHRCKRTEEYYSKDSWRGTLEKEGGSAMINQSIHFVDYLIQLGGEVDKCSGFSRNLTKEGLIETEDVFCGCITFRNGSVGTINLTNASSDNWTYRLTVAGDKGTVELSDDELIVPDDIEWEEEKEILTRLKEDCRPEKNGKSYYGGFHRQNLENFFQHIQDGKESMVSLESQAYTTAAVHELYISAREGVIRDFLSPC